MHKYIFLESLNFFFLKKNSATCEKTFCLQCGHDDTHFNLTCEENMKQLIMQNEQQQINNDFVQTLKWKLENRYAKQVLSDFYNHHVDFFFLYVLVVTVPVAQS